MKVFGKSPIPVPLLLTGKIAFVGCSFFGVVKLLYPGAMLYDSSFTQTAGFVVYAGGLAVLLVSMVHLGKSLAVGIPDWETELQTQGLYRFSRNPMYAGGFVMCAGSCLIAIHPVNVLLFAIAFFVHDRIVRREEEFLEQRFRQKWLEYKHRVPRYFGRIRRARSGTT